MRGLVFVERERWMLFGEGCSRVWEGVGPCSVIVGVVWQVIARRVLSGVGEKMAIVVLRDGRGRDGEYTVGSEIGEDSWCQRSREYGAPVIVWEGVHLGVLI